MIPLTKHAEVTDLAALLIIQLERHGYHATFTEARDIASQILTAQYEHPIARLLSARLALVEAGVFSAAPWFYGDTTREAADIIREWATERGFSLEPHLDGFVVQTADGRDIVTWYPSYAEAAAKLRAAKPESRCEVDQTMWRPEAVGQ
jgi:hypothetical protein